MIFSMVKSPKDESENSFNLTLFANTTGRKITIQKLRLFISSSILDVRPLLSSDVSGSASQLVTKAAKGPSHMSNTT
jgi:hypothetical protein